MLKSGLTVLCYTLPAAHTSLVAVEYAEQLTSLEFTTIAPGGFGTLQAVLTLKNAIVARAELALFARVAVFAGRDCLWVGEIIQPGTTLDDQQEALSISAIGIGNWLRDDPRNTAYSGQTVAQIIAAEAALRSAYTVLSSDLSAIKPGTPAATYSPVYGGRYFEEVIADVAQLDGDDNWGVEFPPTGTGATDATGVVPLARIALHPRDYSTTHYRGGIATGDLKVTITPAAERSYNVVGIEYNDAAQTPPVGVATYTDPRLNGDGSQGTAPFRRRKYFRSLVGVQTVTKAQAQTIANTYGAQYRNPSNKVSIVASRLFDPRGGEVDLWRVVADRNLFVPDLTPRVGTVPGGSCRGRISSTSSRRITARRRAAGPSCNCNATTSWIAPRSRSRGCNSRPMCWHALGRRRPVRCSKRGRRRRARAG